MKTLPDCYDYETANQTLVKDDFWFCGHEKVQGDNLKVSSTWRYMKTRGLF